MHKHLLSYTSKSLNEIIKPILYVKEFSWIQYLLKLEWAKVTLIEFNWELFCKRIYHVWYNIRIAKNVSYDFGNDEHIPISIDLSKDQLDWDQEYLWYLKRYIGIVLDSRK